MTKGQQLISQYVVFWLFATFTFRPLTYCPLTSYPFAFCVLTFIRESRLSLTPCLRSSHHLSSVPSITVPPFLPLPFLRSFHHRSSVPPITVTPFLPSPFLRSSFNRTSVLPMTAHTSHPFSGITGGPGGVAHPSALNGHPETCTEALLRS